MVSKINCFCNRKDFRVRRIGDLIFACTYGHRMSLGLATKVHRAARADERLYGVRRAGPWPRRLRTAAKCQSVVACGATTYWAIWALPHPVCEAFMRGTMMDFPLTLPTLVRSRGQALSHRRDRFWAGRIAPSPAPTMANSTGAPGASPRL